MTNPQDSDSKRIERIEGLVEKLVVDVGKIVSEQAEMKAEQAEMKAEQAEMKAEQAEMKAEQAEMKADMAEMRAEQARMRGEQAEMRAAQEEMRAEQAEMKAEQAEMKSGIARLTRDVDVMKGWQTELVVERRASGVFRQLCRGGHLLRIYPYGELQHYIGAVRHSGNMTEQEFDQAGSTDFVLEGTDREGNAAMYAVEVSFAIGVGDSDRAIGKAELLTRALGREVRPAVAGESSTIEFEDDARRRGIAYAYIGNGRDIVR